MIDRKEIDLLVRARLSGKENLAAVSKSIVELEKAIESQSAAAKRGESSVDELRASLLALQQVQDRLKTQADLVGTFQRMGEQIQKTTDRVSKSSQAYTDYKAKLEGLKDVTDAQQNRLIKLSSAFERAEETLAKQKTRYADLETSLREAGIATDDLAGAETRLRESAATLGITMAKAQKSIDEYGQDVRAARTALADKAREEALAIKVTEQFAAAEKRASDASRKRAEDAAEVARIVSDRNANITSDRNYASDQGAAAARARELAALREDIIKRSEEQLRIEKELAKNSALTKTADEAERAAKSYSTLARASSDLRPNVASLKDIIAGITNPSEAARKSLSGVETEVASLAKTISGIKGPVTDYRTQLKAIADANRSISTQAGLIDSFRQQTAALRTARAEFTAARAKVAEYAAAMRQGGDEGAQFAGALAQASAKAAQAAAALNGQLQATRASKQALADAGIETRNLADAEQRLTSAAKTTSTATKQLGAAVEKYGTQAERAHKKANIGVFGSGGRTTLSLLQRIRGEILALTASYVGLYGAINLAADSLTVYTQREGIRNQLSLSVGNDAAAIDAEYEYVKQQSDRIGLEFERASKGYAKFSAAAKLAGRDQQEIRYIWEAFSEVGRVANISADDLDGVYKALEQITSKGKIQAEELRGQLGDRLFGAFQVAAQALKDEFPNLDKAMQNGVVTSEQLVKIAQKYREIVAEQLPAAQKSLAAEQARLNNAVYDFKLAIADGGWADTYKEMLPILTDFLRSDDGKKFAAQLSDGFASLAEALVFLLKNLDTVKLAAQGVGVTMGLMVTANVITMIGRLGGQLIALTGYLRTTGLAVLAFGGKWPILSAMVTTAFGLMGAAMIGWQVGSWANDEFEVVRKAGIALVTGLEIAWTRIKYGAEVLWEEVPRFAKNAFAEMINIATWGMRKTLGVMQRGLQAIGRDDLAGNIGQVIENMTLGFEKQSSKVATIKSQMEKDIAGIKAIGDAMWKDAERQAAPATSSKGRTTSTVAPTPFPGITPSGNNPAGASGTSDKDVASRQSKIEQIQRALEALDAKIDRSQTETLSKQLDAVDTEYAALARKINALGGETAKEFLSQLNASTAQLKKQITDKFNQGLLDEQQALQNKLEDMEAQAGKKSKYELDKRLAAIKTSYADTYRAIDELQTKLAQNGMDASSATAARARLDAGILELQNLERIKYATEELNRLEKEATDLISLRKDRVEAVRAQQEAGMIDDIQAAEQINRINQEGVPAIQAAAQASKEWALAHAAIFGSPEAMDLFIAKMDTIINGTTQAKTEFSKFGNVVNAEGLQVINGTLDGIFSGLEDIATGQKSVAEGFQDIGKSTIGIFAQFFKDIAIALVKIALFNALKNSGNSYLQAIGTAGAASVGVSHSGGVVGHVANRSRMVPAAIFANAPRYHEGGVPGLAPDEYATILQKNEEVLTADSPRNILNGGASGTGSQTTPQDVSINNYIDSVSFLSAASATPAGRKVITNVISAERSQIRTMLGIK